MKGYYNYFERTELTLFVRLYLLCSLFTYKKGNQSNQSNDNDLMMMRPRLALAAYR